MMAVVGELAKVVMSAVVVVTAVVGEATVVLDPTEARVVELMVGLAHPGEVVGPADPVVVQEATLAVLAAAMAAAVAIDT